MVGRRSSLSRRWAAEQYRWGLGYPSPTPAPGGAGPALPPASPVDTFPLAPLPVRFEILIGTVWVDITASYLAEPGGDDGGEVYGRDTPQIKRGRSDETATLQTSALNFTVNNRDGRYSPRNPLSPYYGKFGQNTTVRCSVQSTTAMVTDPVDPLMAAVVAAPNTPLLITGDLDIRIDADVDNWTRLALAARYNTTGDKRSWMWGTDPDGFVMFYWSTDGTLPNRTVITSTVPAPTWPGRRTLRVTLDVDNGASGSTVTFYYGDTTAGPWTQIGDPVITAGVTSVFAGNATLEVAGRSAESGQHLPMRGRINTFQLMSGIGGTLVADPDFTVQPLGVGSFHDTVAAAQNLWTLQNGSAINDRRFRFHGEISDLPKSWDLTGRDVYIPVTAQGILRRLQQGNSPLRSAVRRGIEALTIAAPVQYWAMEDASGSTTFASALSGGAPMRFTGTPNLATFTGYAGSSPIPTLGSGLMTAIIPAYVSTGFIAVRFLLAPPAAGSPDAALLMSLSFTGTLARLDVRWDTFGAGSFQVLGYDADGVQIFAPSNLADLDGGLFRISIELTQNGTQIDHAQWQTEVGVSGGGGIGATLAANTFGRLTRIQLNGSGTLTDMPLGHLSVHTTDSSILDITNELDGWTGEPAGWRVSRLCDEEGIDFRQIGSFGDREQFATMDSVVAHCVQMGPQSASALVALLQECADADGGMLFEPRDTVGIGYRSRTSMYNQPPAITIGYTANELARVPTPVDDDQNTRNLIIVSRKDGSSATAELTAGAKSTLPPPAGVGRGYDETPTINILRDEELPDHAGWRLLLGTVDEDRWPQVAVSRENLAVQANPVLSAAVQRAEVGDRILVTDPPATLPPDDVSQLIEGYTEALGGYTHAFSFNCSPESPYRVGVLDDAVLGVADTDGSELAFAVDASAVTLFVAVTDGPVWSTAAGDVPFDISVGGEVMTVTAVAGASSPQTFTVTRSVNGVVKAHLEESDVRLTQPMILSF